MLAELHVMLGMMAAVQFLVVSLGDGLLDIVKQLLLYNALFDAWLLAAATACLYAAARLVARASLRGTASRGAAWARRRHSGASSVAGRTPDSAVPAG